MLKVITQLAKNEDGVALAEYGLVLGLIAVVCIGAIQLLANQINGVFTVIVNTLTAAGIAA
jgi:pilus assembly protein Flp/PilA